MQATADRIGAGLSDRPLTGYRLRWTVPGGQTWMSPGVWRQATAAQTFADGANATEEMLHVVVEPVEVATTCRFVDR